MVLQRLCQIAESERLRTTGRWYKTWSNFDLPSLESIRYEFQCRRSMRRDRYAEGQVRSFSPESARRRPELRIQCVSSLLAVHYFEN